MKVLVTAASLQELAPFRKAGFATAPLGTGLTLAGVNAGIAICGQEPDLVINVGTAGTFSKRLVIGSVHSFSQVLNRDQDLGEYHLRRGATLDHACRTVAELSLLGPERYVLASSSAFSCDDAGCAADAADMEAYSVAYAAFRTGKRCAVFKLITDDVGRHVALADYKRILREGREAMFEQVVGFIRTLEK